jgi:hypothetical protein
VLYLDYFTGEYDHTAHLSNEDRDQLRDLAQLDNLVGRIWTAIEASPLADRTVLVLVSDHGMNTDPGTFSQGYSLIDLCSGAGGGHRVMTNRHPMGEYKLRTGPLVSQVISPSRESYYLQARRSNTRLPSWTWTATSGPIYLRDVDLNVFHILMQQMASANCLRTFGQHPMAAIDIVDSEGRSGCRFWPLKRIGSAGACDRRAGR